MKSLQKLAAGLGAAAVMASALLPAAHAQTVAVRRNSFDPISQWIVLDGLFGNSGVFGGNNGVYASGPNGTVVSNGNGYGSGPFNDPIAKWIVLDGLFYNNNGIFDGNGGAISGPNGTIVSGGGY